MATRYTVSDGKLVLKLETAAEGGCVVTFSPRSRTDYGGQDNRRGLRSLDSTGHQEGCGRAHRIAELIASLVYRVESLLAAGWREVRIVTDHGWLLLPGGLPKPIPKNSDNRASGVIAERS